MQIKRLIRHASATHWRTRMLFPSITLDAIETAIARVESAHSGEIRFAIETAGKWASTIARSSPCPMEANVWSNSGVWSGLRFLSIVFVSFDGTHGKAPRQVFLEENCDQ